MAEQSLWTATIPRQAIIRTPLSWPTPKRPKHVDEAVGDGFEDADSTSATSTNVRCRTPPVYSPAFWATIVSTTFTSKSPRDRSTGKIVIYRAKWRVYQTRIGATLARAVRSEPMEPSSRGIFAPSGSVAGTLRESLFHFERRRGKPRPAPMAFQGMQRLPEIDTEEWYHGLTE